MYHHAPTLHKDYRSGVETPEKVKFLLHGPTPGVPLTVSSLDASSDSCSLRFQGGGTSAVAPQKRKHQGSKVESKRNRPDGTKIIAYPVPTGIPFRGSSIFKVGGLPDIRTEVRPETRERNEEDILYDQHRLLAR